MYTHIFSWEVKMVKILTDLNWKWKWGSENIWPSKVWIPCSSSTVLMVKLSPQPKCYQLLIQSQGVYILLTKKAISALFVANCEKGRHLLLLPTKSMELQGHWQYVLAFSRGIMDCSILSLHLFNIYHFLS